MVWQGFKGFVYGLFVAALLLLATIKADKLDTAISNAIFFPTSDLCNGARLNETTFTSAFSSTGGWNKANAKYEEDAFEIEMYHNDPINPNHTWSLRIGKGGQMMSLIGPYGEANANQASKYAAWNDLVTQIVSVDTNLNKQAPYFIHGSGPYMRDVGMPPPFYNPKLALDCQSNQCTSVNWGQQAHIPTVFRSNTIYYQRYRDCGRGIIEYDQAIYRSDNDAINTLNYINTPWSNVRTSTFGQMQISNPSGKLEKPTKLEGFGVPQMRNLDTTGGFTTFSQIPDEASLIRPYNPGFCIDLNKQGKDVVANVPCDTPGSRALKLTVQYNNSVHFSQWHTDYLGYNTFYMTASNLMAPVKQGSGHLPDGGIIVTNSRTKFKFTMRRVLHWAWAGKWMFFSPERSDITASFINEHFRKGDQLLLSYSLSSILSFNPGFCVDPNKHGGSAIANVPCDTPGSQTFKLTVQNNNSVTFSKGHTDSLGYNVFYMTANNLNAPVKQGCQRPPEGGIIVINSRTNFKFIISHVLHWAWAGSLFFFGPESSDMTALVMNEHFKQGDQLLLRYSEIPDDATVELDMLSLSFVHGTNPEYSQQGNSFYNGKSRMRWGLTSGTRDGTVWTSNFMGNLNPTETYYNRKYFISGNANDAESTASSYVPETIEDVVPLGDMNMKGEPIHLFSIGDSFGPIIGSDEFCPVVGSQKICTGSTTPREGTQPLYYITCGVNNTYVGDETYHFIPDVEGGILKPYICKDEPITVRPSFKLLGYFIASNCTGLNDKKYDGDFCFPLQTSVNISLRNKFSSLTQHEKPYEGQFHHFSVLFAISLFGVALFSRIYLSRERVGYQYISNHVT